MNLRSAKEGSEYVIEKINSGDDELNSFLFSLGCYSGEPITVIKHRRSGSVVSVKDARYNFDSDLCEVILVKEKEEK